MKTPRFLVLPCILATTTVSFAEISDAEKIYSIQCGVFETQLDADICEQRIETQGFSPVWQPQTENGFAINFGKFDTNSEAWGISQQMKDFGIIETDIVSFDNTEGLKKSTYQSPHNRLLRVDTPQFVPDIVETRLSNRPDAANFRSALELKDRELIIQAGVSLIERLPDSDKMKGEAMVEVGRAIVQKDLESAPALPYLLKVARCEVASDIDTCIEANFMVADSYHYYWFAPLKAFRAYTEILEQYGDREHVKARCLVEMAACMLELARMPDREWHAEYADVRRYCERVFEEVPAKFERAHATATLMYAESFMYDATDAMRGNDHNIERRNEYLQKSLDAFKDFESKFPNRAREQSMVNHLRGYLYARLGDWENSKASYKKNIDNPITDSKELFIWKGEPWDMKYRSAKRLAYFAEKFDDIETKETFNAMKTQIESQSEKEITDFDFAFPHAIYYEERR